MEICMKTVKSMYLEVYLHAADRELEGHLPEIIIPDDLEVSYHIGDSGDMPEFVKDKNILVISDREDILLSVPEDRKGFTYLVCEGDCFEDIDPKLKKRLSDFWLRSADTEYKLFRLQNLLYRVDGECGRWMYRNLFNTTIDSMPDMMWLKDVDGFHYNVNRVFTEIVNKTKEQCEGAEHYYIWDIPKEEFEKGEFTCKDSDERVLSTGKMDVSYEPVKSAEGMKQFTTYKSPLFDPFGKIIGTVGIGHDVTDFGNMGIQFSMLIENIPFPMLICSVNWKTIRANQHFVEFFGMDEEAIREFSYRDFKKEKMTPVSEAKVDADRHYRFQEFRIECDGKQRSFIIVEQEVRDTFGSISAYYCLFQDVTFQREYEKKILETANTDALTKLWNRRYFYDFLKNNENASMTLLYMDMDNFKVVNDRYGHVIGDEVLYKTARAIEEIYQGSVIARLGGDEFAVLIPKKIEKDVLKEMNLELENRVKGLFSEDGLNISVSIGVVEWNGGKMDIDSFVHAADKRMYEAKKIHHGREDSEKETDNKS